MATQRQAAHRRRQLVRVRRDERPRHPRRGARGRRRAGSVEQPAPGRFSILPLSARTPEALAQVAGQYRSWLSAHPEATLADLCFTAGAARAHLEHRAALVVDSRESAVELLGALAEDRPAPGLVRGESHDSPKTAWLFTGQGSQYPGMARQLYDTEPVFAETLEPVRGRSRRHSRKAAAGRHFRRGQP